MWREKKELGGGEESREGQEPDEVPDSGWSGRPGLWKRKESLNLTYSPPPTSERAWTGNPFHPPLAPPPKLYKS